MSLYSGKITLFNLDFPCLYNPLCTCRFAEPVRKRSKLVLPAPQISDAELEEVRTLKPPLQH